VALVHSQFNGASVCWFRQQPARGTTGLLKALTGVGGATRSSPMLGWVVTFLIIGLIAAIFGFGGIAGTSFAIAKVIFFIALILLLISIVFGMVRRPL
jgi:uncharacterized membrane protein YtjA (UPF0391 family)